MHVEIKMPGAQNVEWKKVMHLIPHSFMLSAAAEFTVRHF